MVYAITTDWLEIVDAAQPDRLVHRGSLHMPQGMLRIAIRDRYLYGATGTTVYVVDVGNADAPVIVGWAPVAGTPADVELSGPWLYVLRTDAVLQVFSLASATEPQPMGSLALPAGCNRRLARSDSLLFAAGNATLEVFDLRGRRVQRLVTGSLAAGEHVARWNGDDDRGAAVAAGIYVARLRAGGRTVAVKITLVN